MNDTSFYIIGPLVGKDFVTYWNLDQGWVMEFELATPFPKEILTLCPLPVETTCILEISIEGEPLAQYNPLPYRGGIVFEKTY